MKTSKRMQLFVCATVLPCMLFGCCNLSRQTSQASQNWVEGKAECVMELHSRRVLYQSRGDTRLPMASTTKIATCITVLEHCDDLQAQVTIPPQAVGVEGSSVYLQTNERYTVEDLLYGLMLRSGNDCAVALALYCGGTIGNFAAKMNETAQKAGALHTNFENPHGLPSKQHYTTAYDLSLITCYAMQNTTFREIVSTKYYAPKHWKNKNKILTLYEGAVGVKTGYTKEAGRCLVSAATKNGMTVITTLLHCATTYERTTKLFNDAFQAYRYTKVVSKEDVFPLSTKKGIVYGCSQKDFFYPLSDGEAEAIERQAIAYTPNDKPNNFKDSVGEFSIYLSKRLLFSGILYKI